MSAGDAIVLGAGLGVMSLIILGMLWLAAEELGWPSVGKFFAVLAAIAVPPTLGALISYTIIIGW